MKLKLDNLVLICYIIGYMSSEFERGKAKFFRGLKTDERIQQANAEVEILLLFEDLSIYIGLVNSANHVTETRKSKNVGASFNHIKELTQGVESSELASAIEKASQIIVNLIEARRKPIFPNLDDLTDIAYTVGVADKKHKSTALLSDIENNEENKRKLIE